jgi:DNA-binding transcriptional LysR family regulator
VSGCCRTPGGSSRSEEARAAVADTEEPSGSLAVGTMESLTSYRLPPLLEYFHHRHPKVRLSLRTTIGDETRQALRQGTYDVGFLMEAATEHAGRAAGASCRWGPSAPSMTPGPTDGEAAGGLPRAVNSPSPRGPGLRIAVRPAIRSTASSRASRGARCERAGVSGPV